jgi:5-methylcytosine-specific restriction endonuclease McrA
MTPACSHAVTPGQFIGPAYYGAWMRGKPLRTTKTRRGAIPRKWRDAVFKHDGYKCVHCGARSELTFGHIVPWIFGGSDEPCNGRTECLTCNTKQVTPAFRDSVEEATARANKSAPRWARDAATASGDSVEVHWDWRVD